jgi:pyruvate/2-oxoglutarate dehydrogenase complex dihydrolipoamide dehydrogenase (E3) component
MTFEGAKVEAVLEIMPYSNGLARNIVQCLDDFGIPLILESTITKIHGKERVEGVTMSKVDSKCTPIPGTEKLIPCDTVLLSVGLIPENEITRYAGITIDKKTNGPIVGELRQTSKDGVFACGNVLQVHDVVDFVSEEGEIAGIGAAQYIHDKFDKDFTHTTTTSDRISYVIPQKINAKNVQKEVRLYMRVKKVFDKSAIKAYIGDKLIATKKEIKFLPAEMVSFNIKKEDLIDSSGNEIKVKVENI